jgi:hypothetical protein
MYFWHIEPLGQRLNANLVTRAQTVLYAIIAAFTFAAGLSVFSWFPLLYYFGFSAVKKYLEKQADPAPLNITVFSHLDFYFVIAKIAIIILGIIYCIKIITHHRFYTKLKHIICMAVPVNIRLITVGTIFFAIIYLILSVYFGFQLSQLLETEPLKKGLGSLFSKISPIRLIKTGIAQYTNYKRAQLIFDKINVASYFLYLISNIAGLIFGILFFWTIGYFLKKTSVSEA